ncbi:hypothetical protein K8T06_00990 [bacterium]|nr:hypothetical protein [bacterium]
MSISNFLEHLTQQLKIRKDPIALDVKAASYYYYLKLFFHKLEKGIASKKEIIDHIENLDDVKNDQIQNAKLDGETFFVTKNGECKTSLKEIFDFYIKTHDIKEPLNQKFFIKMSNELFNFFRAIFLLYLNGTIDPNSEVPQLVVYTIHSPFGIKGEPLLDIVHVCTQPPRGLKKASEILSEFDRSKTDISYWYYQHLQRVYSFYPSKDSQVKLRNFVAKIEKIINEGQSGDMWNQFYETFQLERHNEIRNKKYSTINTNFLSSFSDESNQHKLAILEACWMNGFFGYNSNNQNGYFTGFGETEITSNLIAKVFGFKSSIVGFDDLLGGGLVQHPASKNLGLLTVIRGRFATGKSTMALNFAFDMARKGGVGVLIVIEQSVDEVLSQAAHFGFISSLKYDEYPQFDLICPDEGNQLGIYTDDLHFNFLKRIREIQESESKKGLLLIQPLADNSLVHFESVLNQLTSIEELSNNYNNNTFSSKFIIVDPIDALQLFKFDKDLNFHNDNELKQLHFRNRTQQTFNEVKQTGFSLFLTTSDVLQDVTQSQYRFIPNIGDVVIRLSLSAGDLSLSEEKAGMELSLPPIRLLEIEKVRTQRFAKGLHPFEINSKDGIRIFPAGDAITKFVSWRHPNEASSNEKNTGVSLGHSTLNEILKLPDGVRTKSMTTLMGPTGCAKTELGLLFLLENGKDRSKAGERSLFISFRDSKETLEEIIKGPMRTQLKYKTFDKTKEIMDLCTLNVGSYTSASIFQKIRKMFKSLKSSKYYTRVVVDNIAYMELTSPRIKNDDLFVPNLLTLFKQECVTPMFVTSLIEGPGFLSSSRLQAQIRDASHTLIVLKRNSFEKHHFIAMQIQKSQKLDHFSEPVELIITEDPQIVGTKKEGLAKTYNEFTGKRWTKNKSSQQIVTFHKAFLEHLKKGKLPILNRRPDGSPYRVETLTDKNAEKCMKLHKKYWRFMEYNEIEKGLSIRRFVLNDYRNPLSNDQVCFTEEAEFAFDMYLKGDI